MGARRDGFFWLRTYWWISALLNMVWFAGPTYDLIAGQHPVAVRAVAAVGLVAFLVFYTPAVFTAWFRPDDVPDPIGRIVAGTVLAVALTIGFGPAWAGLVTYCAYLAGATIRRSRVAIAAVGAIAAVSAVTATVATGSVASAAWAGYTLFIGLFAVSYGRIVATYRELYAARSDLARMAVADERLRFARDLHDLLGHSLSVIALKSELAGRVIDTDPGRAAAEVHDIEAVAREALAEVREAVSGYRDSADLAAELDRARSALAAAGVEVHIDEPTGPLPAEVESLLAWTVREGATNIVRHAGARRATIRVHDDDGAVGVEVLDDGTGEPDPARPTAGNGLDGLAERVSAAAGAFEAGGAPGGGFRLAVRVPR